MSALKLYGFQLPNRMNYDLWSVTNDVDDTIALARKEVLNQDEETEVTIYEMRPIKKIRGVVRIEIAEG